MSEARWAAAGSGVAVARARWVEEAKHQSLYEGSDIRLSIRGTCVPILLLSGFMVVLVGWARASRRLMSS